jgi:NADH-quinone oxidoreductase subunit G
LRDLTVAVGGSNGLYTIEEVFKLLAASHPALAGLNLGKIGDLGLQLEGLALYQPVPVPAAPSPSASALASV